MKSVVSDKFTGKFFQDNFDLLNAAGKDSKFTYLYFEQIQQFELTNYLSKPKGISLFKINKPSNLQEIFAAFISHLNRSNVFYSAFSASKHNNLQNYFRN